MMQIGTYREMDNLGKLVVEKGGVFEIKLDKNYLNISITIGEYKYESSILTSCKNITAKVKKIYNIIITK